MLVYIYFTSVLFDFFFLSLSSFSFSSTFFLPFLQLVIGRFAVSLASVFVRCRQGEWRPGKKTGFGVTFTHVSDTYHLLHQINMASEWVCGCVGVGGWMHMSMSQKLVNCAHTRHFLPLFHLSHPPSFP